jgi:raffinose/stachyose/melibiose transport system permease protein
VKIGRGEQILSISVLSLFSLFAIIPLVGVLLSSLIPPAENSGGFTVPRTLSFGNYGEAWDQGHFGGYLLSTILVTISVVVLTTIVSVLAGFAIARLRFRGATAIFFIMLAGLTLPEESFIIPLYFNLRGAGLTDTYWALILPQTAQSVGFGVFWMRSQFAAYPSEIIEAARLDGASDFRLLWRVVVPSSFAPIMTMCVLISMWTWNEFLMPLVMIVSDNLRTEPLGLAFFQGQHLTSYSLLSAAGVIVALPIVILYFVLQRRFISGMVGGISLR